MWYFHKFRKFKESIKVNDNGRILFTSKTPTVSEETRTEFILRDTEGNEKSISLRIQETDNREFSEIINLSMEKKEFESQSKFKIVKPLLDYLFLEGNPSGIKSALHKLNLCENILRLPLVPVSDELKIKINNSISTIIKDY